MPGKRWLLLIFPALIVAFILWWFFGGAQHWLAIHTGTDYCVNLPANDVSVCKAYGFWSGFGSDLGEYVIVASFASSLVLLWRTNTCARHWWCWRKPVHPLVGNEQYKLCGTHHPDDVQTVEQAVRHHIDLKKIQEKASHLRARRQTDG